MYAKLENGKLIEAPYYQKRTDGSEVFGYNFEQNSVMLLKDGWKPVVFSEPSLTCLQPVSYFEETLDSIVQKWKDFYIAPKPVTNEDIRQERESQYRIKVDGLLAEYSRKELFGLFEAGEAEALKAEIAARVSRIKEENPYLGA
nr:MAG TPA: hypothetical protein [Caudoviricetes sp.]